jgi:preprotein translocase subunit SecF
MFDELYTQLTRIVPYKKLMFVPVVIAVLMLLLVPSVPLGMEFKGGTSIEVTLTDSSGDNPESMKAGIMDDLSAYGLEKVNVYFKKSVTSESTILAIETVTQLKTEDEEAVTKILEKYVGRVNKFDTAEAKLTEKPSKDDINKIANSLGVSNDDLKYDENTNTLTITSLGLDKDKIQGELNSYLKGSVQFNFYERGLKISPISPSLGEKFKTQGMEALLITYILVAFVIFIAFSRDISFEAVLLGIGYTILVLILIKMGWVNNLLIVGIIILLYLILMTVFIIYRLAVPASAVIAAATCDIVIALGGMTIFGIELELASLGALFMLIGYSVDSDVLLTSRTLKGKVGTVDERINDAMKTGLTMTGAAIVALGVMFIISSMVTQIETLTAITSVLLIGLFADVATTWFMNTGILKWYLEQPQRKKRKFNFGFSIFGK